MKRKQIAVVTGASGGLGQEFIQLLLKERQIDEVWAVARHRDKLERLQKGFGQKIRICSMDVSDMKDISIFQEQLGRERPEIHYLINCAGYARFCSYRDLSVEESVRMISVNCCGMVATGLSCIPYMKRGSYLINIASQAAFQPLPYLNLYSATKAFIRNYSRALEVKLKSRKIYVTTVCPGWMDTPLIPKAEIGARKTVRRFNGIVTPDKVAAKAMRDARKRKSISVYSLYVKSSHVLAKILPQRTVMYVWLRNQGWRG